MEASALPAPVSLARTRISIGASLLRLRSDDQLVSLFRAGSEDAFRVIHDRYRQRLFVYTRQMLGGSPQDAEDAVQEIFVRAYAGLRCSDRRLTLRAWLYRVAHNRCVDQLRRPLLPTADALESLPGLAQDPAAKAEQREALRRLIADVQRLPDQQRSALLMRELGGMAYTDLAEALSVSVPAVKSLLVRARVSLAQASEARETACSQIREELILAHDRGVRASGLAKRHLRDCPSCREFRFEVRGVSRQLAAFVPALGPFGVIANLLGIGGGAGAGGSAAASSGVVAAGGAAAGGVVSTGGALASAGIIATGAGHVATLLVAAAVTAGGAVEIQHTIAPPTVRHAHHHRVVSVAERSAPPAAYVAPEAPVAPVYQSPLAAPQPSVAPPSPSPHPVDRAQVITISAPSSSTAGPSTASPSAANGEPSGGSVSTGTGGTSNGGNSASATAGSQAPASTTPGTSSDPSSTASTSASATGTSTSTANSGPDTSVTTSTVPSATAAPAVPNSATTATASTGTGSGAPSSGPSTSTSATAAS